MKCSEAEVNSESNIETLLRIDTRLIDKHQLYKLSFCSKDRGKSWLELS